MSHTLKIFKFLRLGPTGFFCNTVVVIHFPGFCFVLFPRTFRQQQLQHPTESACAQTNENASSSSYFTSSSVSATMANKNYLQTRSSATTNTMCQSKSCQRVHNSVGTTCTTNPEQIEAMELECQPTNNKLVHSATTLSVVAGVIHKLNVDNVQ